MRELSNIFQGLCLSKAEFYPTPEKFVRLWTHECLRVFQDRMVTDSDIDRFFDLLNEQAKRTFKDLDQDELAVLPNIFTQFATKTGGDPAYVEESYTYIIFTVWREICTLRNEYVHTET
jgi:dynein heavy chain